jgi:hypothetical protein
MMRRRARLRFLSLLWAAVHLAIPALGSVADARLAAAAGDPVAHIESTTSSSCPVIHAPDCGLCRYLSSVSDAPDAACTVELSPKSVDDVKAATHRPAARAIVLPDGRAPPVV